MKILSLHAMTDIVSTFRKAFEEEPPPVNEVSEKTEDKDNRPPTLEQRRKFIDQMSEVLEIILRLDAEDDNAGLKPHAAIAASKLLLYNLLPEDHSADLLRALVELYFNPENANTPCVQTLAYCLPTFCHVSLKNAHLMAEQAPHIIMGLFTVDDEDYLDDDTVKVSWDIVGSHIAEWTDGRHVVLPRGIPAIDHHGKRHYVDGAEEPHLELAFALVERIMKGTKEIRKALFPLLRHLHISATKLADNSTTDRFGPEQIRELWELVQEAIADQIADDATQRNILTKLEATLAKRVEEAEGPIDEAEEQAEVSSGTVHGSTERRSEEDTVVLADKLADTQIKSEAQGGGDIEEEEEEEDTMLAGMQGEGTRMPLEEEDDSDDEPSFKSTVREQGPRVYTEDDIVASLLQDDLSEDSSDAMDIGG